MARGGRRVGRWGIQYVIQTSSRVTVCRPDLVHMTASGLEKQSGILSSPLQTRGEGRAKRGNQTNSIGVTDHRLHSSSLEGAGFVPK